MKRTTEPFGFAKSTPVYARLILFAGVLLSVFAGACSCDEVEVEEKSVPYWVGRQKCKELVDSDESGRSVYVVNSQYCAHAEELLSASGILIMLYNDSLETAQVLWSYLNTSSTNTLYCLIDLTGDENPEILSFYYDESAIWGHIVRIKLGNDAVTVESVAIPETGFSDEDLFRLPVDSNSTTLVMPEKTSDLKSVVIHYDSSIDSLCVSLYE